MLVNLKKLRTRHKNRVDKGIYEMKHWLDRFNFDNYLRDHNVPFYEVFEMYKINKENGIENFLYSGVCDNHEQILEKCPMLVTSKDKYVIGLTKVRKDKQPLFGGWRWSKWGEYIGDMKPTDKYLRDEKEIDQVYVFEVYQVKD